MNSWLGFLRSLIIYNNPQRRVVWKIFYRKLLNKGDIAFDIGAHVGTRTRAMRAAEAKVIALEPQKPFSSYLAKTLPNDVVFIEAAAGASEMDAEMAVSSKHPTVSSMRTEFVDDASNTKGFEKVRWDKKQLVKMVTLDGLIKTYGKPSYIKIDVEGYELQVLSGLSSPVSMISVEYLPGFPNLTQEVISRLLELGEYEFNPVVGENAKFLWSEWKNAEGLKSWLQAQPATGKASDLFARLKSEAS